MTSYPRPPFHVHTSYVALFCAVSLKETIEIIALFYAALLLYIVMAIAVIVAMPSVGKAIGDYAKFLVRVQFSFPFLVKSIPVCVTMIPVL